MFEWFGKVSYCPHTKVSGFAQHLKDGSIMASRCKDCGYESFPPRADCPKCLSGDFEYFEISGKGTIQTYTRIEAAPAGFEDVTPFTLGVVDLEETGRLLAWFGETIPEEEIEIGMEVQVVPRMFEDTEEVKLYLSLEKPGTTWVKSSSAR
jgi:uncharacterized OB-fold protein